MRLAMLFALIFTPFVSATEIVVHVPTTMRMTHAEAKSGKETVSGTISADGIHFAKLQPETKYDLSLTESDGHVDQGVDSSWYDGEAPDPKTASLDDDDRQQINAILTEIKSFYDRTEQLAIWGDHDRAVVLVQRIRESKFHSDKGGEAIWRVELWYLKNEAGGWAKVSQQDKTLRRERYDSSAEMKREIEKVRWRPELGGVRVEKDQTKTITPAPAAGVSDPP